jgi:iron(III) transport system substrate-binding protein
MTAKRWRAEVDRRTFLGWSGAAAAGLLLGGPSTGRAAAAGKVLQYCGGSAESVTALDQLFTAKTGITAESWRAGGVAVVQKVEAEFQAGRVLHNVIGNTEVEVMVRWAEQGHLLNYDSPEASHFPREFRMPGYWVPQKVLINTIAYNTGMLKPEEAPKHWADLMDPRWKDKIVMLDARASGAGVHFVYVMRKLLGKEFATRMAKQNVMLKRSGGDVANTVVAGERPLGVALQEYYVYAKAKQGGPIMAVLPDEGVPMTLYALCIPKNGPDLDAAKRYVDFALGKEAQTLWQEKFGTPVLRGDVPPYPREFGLRPLKEVKIIFSATEHLKEEGATKREFLDEWKQVSG